LVVRLRGRSPRERRSLVASDAYRTLGVALLAQGRYDEAAGAAGRSVQLAPGSLIERAMGLNPNYPALYLGILGNAYRAPSAG
jgi:hypothetical protein